MYYKEFLRIRHFFMWFAMVMTVIAALCVLFSNHATVHVSVDHPTHTAAVARHGIVVAADRGEAGSTNVYAPGVEVSNEPNEPFPFSIVLAIAGFVAAIFGTVAGTCLAAENCNHLEIAWTRPASRIAYAARIMAVDIGGIFAAFAYCVILSLAVIYACGWQHHMTLDPGMGATLLRFVLYALAWFGLIAALTASVRGRAGAIAGFSWVAGAILIALLDIDLPRPVHALLTGLNYLNPMIYGSFSSGAEAARHVMQLTVPTATIGLSAIAVLGIAAALAQWQRLEA